MKKIKLIIILCSIAFLFNACSLLTNSGKYKSVTQDFVNNMLNEQYDKSIDLFALDNPAFAHITRDSLKKQLIPFRKILADNFGTKLDYSFIQASKTFSTEKKESTPPNTTNCLIQFSNDKYFGQLRVLFDDKSNKILDINTVDMKEIIPSMTGFWVFCIFPIGVVLFNIYAIVKVKRSKLKRKWLLYLAIVVLNIPTIGYTPLSGITISLFNFQILLGFSFEAMGYADSLWAFGIPIGAIIALIRIRNSKKEVEESEGDTETISSGIETDDHGQTELT